MLCNMSPTLVTFLVLSLTFSPFTVLATSADASVSDCNLAPNALVLAETDENNVATRINVCGPTGLVSTGGAATTTRYYPITDAQGSVRFLTDSAGAVTRSMPTPPMELLPQPQIAAMGG